MIYGGSVSFRHLCFASQTSQSFQSRVVVTWTPRLSNISSTLQHFNHQSNALHPPITKMTQRQPHNVNHGVQNSHQRPCARPIDRWIRGRAAAVRGGGIGIGWTNWYTVRRLKMREELRGRWKSPSGNGVDFVCSFVPSSGRRPS